MYENNVVLLLFNAVAIILRAIVFPCEFVACLDAFLKHYQ